MIPLKDENPTRTTAVVTLVLIAACVFVYFGVQQRNSLQLVQSGPAAQACGDFEFSMERAAIPYELTNGRPLTEPEAEELKRELFLPQGIDCVRDGAPDSYPSKSIWLSVLYSMFLHGGLLHLGGNMLYLWVFGNNIEDRKGKITYVVFYVLAGVAATVAHVLVDPHSPIPVVGASGAIAGVMGAYLVLYPNARIRSLVFLGIFATMVAPRAKWVLGFWFVSQFFINPNSGVASMAHVGGFVFGVAAGLLWRAQSPRPPQPVQPGRPATPYGY